MITKETYTIEYVNTLREKYKKDPSLLERVLFAFGLLEAITRVGMPFIFKGGTSLMLILDHPLRLSTDIDILVKPGTDVDHYINEAAKIFPFKTFDEDRRVGKNNIEKRHFKFIYDSPLRNDDFYILLDIVFADSPYLATQSCEIKNELLLTDNTPITVTVPSPECILGDKLTAFAPHTTGVPFGIDKELEIIKQLFDVATLSEKIDNYQNLISTYDRAVLDEIGYRDITASREDVLRDTIRSCACIIGKGIYDKDDFPLFIKGIHSIGGHVLSMKYSATIAAEQASRVMYLASCMLTGQPFAPVENAEAYLQANIGKSQYKKLSYMRSQSPEAFAYIVESLRMIKE